MGSEAKPESATPASIDAALGPRGADGEFTLDHRTYFDIAVDLLRFARANPPVDVADDRLALFDLSDRVRRIIEPSALALFDGPSAEEREQIARAASRLSTISLGTVATAIARGIDSAAGHTFLACFRTKYEHQVALKYDDPYPVRWPRPHHRPVVVDERFDDHSPTYFNTILPNPGALELRPWESTSIRFWDQSPESDIEMILTFAPPLPHNAKVNDIADQWAAEQKLRARTDRSMAG